MTQKDHISLARISALAVTSIGLIQGIAWLIFSILCICCYFEAILCDVSAIDAYDEANYKQIYWLFLTTDSSLSRDDLNLLVTPKTFFIFMWFYGVLSLVWTVISGTTFHEIFHNKWKHIKYLVGGFVTVTILISILDVILMALFISDYNYLTTYLNDVPETTTTIYKAMIVLSVRGGILWILNVISVAVIIKFAVDVIRERDKEPQMDIIDGYETNSGSPFHDNILNEIWATSEPATPRAIENVYTNKGFERSASFFPVIHEDDPEEIYSEPYEGDLTSYSSISSDFSTRPSLPEVDYIIIRSYNRS